MGSQGLNLTNGLIHPLVNGLTELLGDGNFRRSLAGEVDPGEGCALELGFSPTPVLFFSLL